MTRTKQEETNMNRKEQRNLLAFYRGKMFTNYPTLHLMKDGESICDACMESEQSSILHATLHPEYRDHQWQYVTTYEHLEGPAEFCAHCNKQVESAYGDPEESENP